MHITDLEWDDDNVEHIARHGVSPAEVEDVCFGVHLSSRDPASKAQGKDRYILAGQSKGGRFLDVVVERLYGTTFRAVRAFEMSETAKKTYKNKLRKWQ